MAGNLTAMIAAIFSGGVSTDPYFNLTTLLLSTTATNGQQNNTFQDSSTNNFTITRNPATGPNAPTQGTFSPFSQTGWGNYFSANTSELSFASNAAFNLSGVSWTIEFWAYPTENAPARDRNWITRRQASGAFTSSYQIYCGSGANTLKFLVTGQTVVTSTSSLTPNQWNHVAVVWNGTTLYFYINGVQDATTGTYGAGTGADAEPLRIGRLATNDNVLSYMSNVRVVKGVAVYTGNFTVPSTPLAITQSSGTNISAITGTQTSLLTCQTNRFVDVTANAFVPTVGTGTSVQAFSPFAPTSAWSASTVGGSGYFVYASANYLSTTVTVSDFFTALGDFTFEGWVYPLSFLGPQYSCPLFAFGSDDLILRALPTSATSTSLNIYGITSAGGAAFGGSGTSGGTIRLNEWAWVVFTRQSGVLNLWVNGTRVVNDSTFTSTQLRQTATSLRIGGGFGGTNPYWNGYLSGIKWTSGAALYSGATISMPTAPPTTTVSSGTNRLLLNFTNSGIYDATAKNVLETVGNAQVSTTQSKWSPTSMYFDGTGDYLAVPDSRLFDFTSSNWTIEFWMYRTVNATQTLITKRTSNAVAGIPNIFANTSNKIVVECSGQTALTPTGTISNNVWTHVAIVRSGSGSNNVKIYFDGTADATSVTWTTMATNTSPVYIGADTNGNGYTGYLQDIRISRYARYTANFTPPTAAFPVQ